MRMKTLKGWIPTTVLAATLLFGSVTAHAGDGVITGGYASTTDPCTVDQKLDTGVITGGLKGVITGGLTGVITGGFTGVITGGFTGIIVTDFKSDGTVSCGVITGG
jgi:hypothetical protein